MFDNNYTFIIAENLANYRLDKAVASLSILSRVKIQEIISNNLLKVNSKVINDVCYKVQTNDQIDFIYDTTNETITDLKPLDMELNIVFEDEYLLVINKPSGLTVHPGAGNHHDTLANALVHHFGQNLSQISGSLRPGIVHRLDKDTSGLMIVAKDDITHAAISNQIAARQVKRHYQALVWGLPNPQTGTITTNIGRARDDRTKMSVVKEGGKLATTHYKVIDILSARHLSLVECRLETGRTHQIRVHMSHLGHSVVGDQTYGHNKRKAFKYLSADHQVLLENFKRQALHSAYLSFIHPITQILIEHKCDLPSDMQDLINFGKIDYKS